MLRTLASRWNKEGLDVFEAKIEKMKRPAVAKNQIWDTWLVQPVLCHKGTTTRQPDNQTTTSPHNPQYTRK